VSMKADQLSTGKRRRLQQCATEEGVFSILAIDHRNNLRRSLDPRDPDSVSDEALVEFKLAVVRSLAPEASGVLIDPEYGVEPVITANALPGKTGLIVAIERSGYVSSPNARMTELLPDWNVEKISRTGASGVKLLIYYHPDAPTAPQIEDLTREVAQACSDAEIPLFLEPLSYSLDPDQRKLTSQERRRVVVETARRLTTIRGVDILKAEFPLDIVAATNETEWLEACAELTEASAVPWVLLSAGVDFETYLHQVAVASRAGASGVAVGRAVWKEGIGLSPAERDRFLSGAGRDRMAKVTSLCRTLSRPWTDGLKEV